MSQKIVDDSMGPKFFKLIAYEMCPDFDNDLGSPLTYPSLIHLLMNPKMLLTSGKQPYSATSSAGTKKWL